jgi:hypothetical protein
MSTLRNLAFGVALGFAASAPGYSADTPRASQPNQADAWSDAQVRAAMDKCNNLTGTERARCIVNIRPAGGGGSSVAVGVSDENTVKTGKYTDEEYMAAMKKCDTANDKDRCVADVKDHFGRM